MLKQADSRKCMASLRALVQGSVSVNSAICTFHPVVQLGPDFVRLLLCHRMMHWKSVALCNKAHYTKLDADLYNDVFSAGVSCECS